MSKGQPAALRGQAAATGPSEYGQLSVENVSPQHVLDASQEPRALVLEVVVKEEGAALSGMH